MISQSDYTNGMAAVSPTLEDALNATTPNTFIDSTSFTVDDGNGESCGTEMSISLHSNSFQQAANMVDSGIDADIEFNREMYNLLIDNNFQPIYSRKVFLGGLPPYITTEHLQQFFSTFGPVEVGWPVTENSSEPEGYMFATFASADSVVKLVDCCAHVNSRLTISIPFSNTQSANINIRVWCTKDVKYCSPECNDSFMRNSRNCVFVGGIPRTMTAISSEAFHQLLYGEVRIECVVLGNGSHVIIFNANYPLSEQLSYFMSITFGDVVFAKIEVELETDYPKGAACVMFHDREAFVAAIAKRFVPLNFGEHIKQIELQPYLMRMVECDVCQTVRTRNFCPQLRCLKFMCDLCWKQAHADMPDHQPQVRSPPLRARQLAQINSDDRTKDYTANAQPVFRSARMRLNDPSSNARNFDSHSDWNTDCGIFDSRGPPPHAFRSRPTSDTNRQPTVPQHSRGRFGFTLEKNGSSANHRNRWSKGPAQKHSNTRYRYYYPSHTNHCNSISNNDYRPRLPDHHHDGPSSLCYPSYGKGESQWSDRISRASSSTNARSLIASNVNQLARQRVSFSPTVRRPARRQSGGGVHCSTNNISVSDENSSNNIIDAFAQFKLF